ncbi:isocitrate lyase/PEP mutase family protein [Nocardioides nematodiphilus]|uniref:isocitrate lyase/PEP mutase family protein n=1 Tax=Nocardioides nematodiphilus TaxID=2849669 RepID=UPI001CDA15CE|nr:isocitrate lyase/phosphoenolpyruvate mutase family protein [Nocardioides nematodiphilus]MCA1984711.1 isocitrate lyase/phosphoenolpyruvate mutase family protein [Nocardioides nematodiphilus]
MSDVTAKASELLRLHHTGETLVLPTAWDAWSARTIVEAGFTAVSVGSHPLADSRGQQDNEGMTLSDALDSIRRITAAVDVPVTADMESGYDTPAAELVERVLEAGVAGINIEDTVHSQGRLREVQEHADYIGAIRAAADEAGVELVINARTDAFLGVHTTFEDPLAEAVRRLRACEEAGARCVYPVRIPDNATLRSVLDQLSGPVNVTAHPIDGAMSGSLEELRAAGVQRITFGPLLMMALTPKLTELVTPWL